MKGFFISFFVFTFLMSDGQSRILPHFSVAKLSSLNDSSQQTDNSQKQQYAYKKMVKRHSTFLEGVEMRNQLKVGKNLSIDLDSIEETPVLLKHTRNDYLPRRLKNFKIKFLNGDNIKKIKNFNKIRSERNLMEIDFLQEKLFDAAKQNGMIIHPAKTSNPDDFYMTDRTDEEFTIEKNDRKIFKVFKEQEDLNSSAITLIITNKPDDEDFENFKLNHFQFRIAIDSSQSKNEEFEAELSQFLGDSTLLISQKLKHLEYEADPGAAICGKLIEKLPDIDFQSKVIEESYDENMKKSAILITATVKANKKTTYFLLSPTYSLLYNFQLMSSYESFEFDFDIMSLDEVFDNASKTIGKLLLSDLRGVETSSHYINKVVSALKKRQCDAGPATVDQYGLYTADLSSPEGKNKNCQLPGYRIEVATHNVGNLNAVHLKAESEKLLQEFIIHLNSEFDNSLEAILKDIASEESDTDVAINKNKKDEIIPTTLKGIFDAIGKLKKQKVNCEAPNGNGFVCTFDVAGKKFVVLKAVEYDEGDGFFRISLIDPPNIKAKNNSGYFHPEIYLGRLNGYDQSTRLKKHIQPFFARLSNIK